MGLPTRADASDLRLDTLQKLARLAPEQLEEVAVDAAVTARHGLRHVEKARIAAHDRHGEAVAQSGVDRILEAVARDLCASEDLAELVLDRGEGQLQVP